ncbi:MAG: hypothetical protein Q3971_07445 [Moraxella sp.]|nr:hypothetical protein [Moraxella sp.]
MFGKQASVMVILAIMPLLSGCFATMMLHDSAKKTTTDTKVHLSDTITHIGAPKTPLSDHPHALVMVGNRQSYLLTSPSAHRPSLLKDIFTQIDTTHLYIRPKSQVSDDKQNLYQISVSDNHCYAQNKLCDTVWLHYQKPVSALKKGEKAQLQNLGFTCNNTPSTLECTQKVGVHIHLVNKITNHHLPHRLKQPIELRVVEELYHHKTNKGLMLLTPVAVGVDVVTFPVQFLMVSYWLRNK